jgi:hypothetical protein
VGQVADQRFLARDYAPAKLVGTRKTRADARLGAARLDPSENVIRRQDSDATPVLVHYGCHVGTGSVEQARRLADQHLTRDGNKFAIHQLGSGYGVS